jgi:DNA-binding transcriptional ArsR family regulator
MHSRDAIPIMSALAQPTRLAIFETLAASRGQGIASGELADKVGTSTASMSAHLAILARAGLIEQEKIGRHVLCRAIPAQTRRLSAFIGQLAFETHDS